MADDVLHAELSAHLERRYAVTVKAMARLQQWNEHVHRVDLADGLSWVARIFGAARPLERVLGDAEILRHVETHGYPAERLANDDAVSALADGRSVVVTDYIQGTEPDGSLASTQGTLAELLGRLATLPCDQGAAARPAGAWGSDPRYEGRPRQDILAALDRLAEIDGRVPPEHLQRFDSLRRQLADVDDLEGLPEALVHPDPAPVNAREKPDGSVVFTDWTSAGRGPRIAVLGWFLGGVNAPGGYDEAKLSAVIDGYCSHVRLEDEELDRLPDAMRIRGLFFACLSFSTAIVAGRPPSGPGLHWCSDEDNRRGTVIAEAVRALLE